MCSVRLNKCGLFYSKRKGVSSIKTEIHFFKFAYIVNWKTGVMFREIFQSAKGFHRRKSSGGGGTSLVFCRLIFGESSKVGLMFYTTTWIGV